MLASAGWVSAPVAMVAAGVMVAKVPTADLADPIGVPRCNESGAPGFPVAPVC